MVNIEDRNLGPIFEILSPRENLMTNRLTLKTKEGGKEGRNSWDTFLIFKT